MLEIKSTSIVYYTCKLYDDDEQKILDYIKSNPIKFEFMTSESKITKAVEELYANGNIDIYKDSTESDFFTDSIEWSEFEEKNADDILNQQLFDKNIFKEE